MRKKTEVSTMKVGRELFKRLSVSKKGNEYWNKLSRPFYNEILKYVDQTPDIYSRYEIYTDNVNSAILVVEKTEVSANED